MGLLNELRTHVSRRYFLSQGSHLFGSAALATLAGRDWAAIARLLAEWRPDCLVVGVPRHADGSDSDTTRAALRFARQLGGRHALPVETIDEHLSSHAAAERLACAPRRARRSGPGLDAAAADKRLHGLRHGGDHHPVGGLS